MAMTNAEKRDALDELNVGWESVKSMARSLYSVGNEIEYVLTSKLKTMAALIIDANHTAESQEARIMQEIQKIATRLVDLETRLTSHQSCVSAHSTRNTGQERLFGPDEPEQEPKSRDMIEESHFVLVDAPMLASEVRAMMDSHDYHYYSFAELDRMVGLKEGRIKDAVDRCKGQEFIRVRTDLIKAIAKLISPSDVTSFFERVGVRFLSKH